MPMKTECEECGEDVGRFKHLKKIGDKRICKSCARKRRQNKRKETIENNPELKNDLRKLKSIETNRYYKLKYEKKKRERLAKQGDFPVIKGSKLAKKKSKSSCYISLEEKRNYLRILMLRGLDFEDAKYRIEELIESQKTRREEMKKQGKSEDDIKEKQQEMLEELWRI